MTQSIRPDRPALGSLSFDAIAQLAGSDAPPPVERWHPAHCGDSDMRIASDGRWYHQGGLIARAPLVRLFSRILRREPDGSHVLVTPAEKLSITVEDAPFIAVAMTSSGTGRDRVLAFELNTGDLVVAGGDHPLSFTVSDTQLRPYLHVRGPIGNGLTALVARSLVYELVDLAIRDGEDDAPFALWSGGCRFPLPA